MQTLAVQRVIRQHPHAVAAADGAGALGEEQHGVGVVPQHAGGGEDLPGTHEVKLLGPVEDQQPVRCHVRSLVDRNRSRKSDGATLVFR